MLPDRDHELKRSSVGSTLTELPLSLTVLFFLVFMPMIDLFGLGTGAAVTYMLAHETASGASQQRHYVDALNSIQTKATDFQNTGFSKFAKLVPVGGYGGSGVDLYIDASNYRTNALKRFGPNSPVPAPVDLSNWVYECTTQATFEVGPVIDLSFVPLVGLCPGLGKPAIITYFASRASENAIGLEVTGNNAPGGNGSVPPFNQTPTQTGFSGPEQSDWNLPTIYQQIKAAGQTPIAEEVVIVDAINKQWTDTGINVQQGQKVWIDLHSDGLWTIYPLTPEYNANGDQRGIPIPNMIDMSQPPGCLLGKVGNSPMFKVGVQYLNYAPSFTGEVMLVMNDDAIDQPGYGDNIGKQVVRVILTQ